MAWYGWKTIGEAQRYVEEANRIRLSESAGVKMRTGSGNPSPGLTKSGKNTMQSTAEKYSGDPGRTRTCDPRFSEAAIS